MVLRISYDDISLDGEDYKMFRIIKGKKNKNCNKCGSEINVGSYHIGAYSYYACCINCFDEYMKGFDNGIKRLISLQNDLKDEYTKNKDKMIKHNLVRSI